MSRPETTSRDVVRLPWEIAAMVRSGRRVEAALELAAQRRITRLEALRLISAWEALNAE
jgi:hypothetical protein